MLTTCRISICGVDGQSIGRFAVNAELHLPKLSAALKEGTNRPDAVKRVEVPKGDGKTRPLGIPPVKDRIVQPAVRLVLEPSFKRDFGSQGVVATSRARSLLTHPRFGSDVSHSHG